MEQQIQDLINSIKKDGIESANNESKKILDDANKKAEMIISEATKKKNEMLEEAKKQIALERESSMAAVKQGARDLSLSFVKGTEEKFTQILKTKIDDSFSADVLKEVIVLAIQSEFDSKDVVVELPEKYKKTIADSILSDIKKEVEKDGLAFSFSSSLSGGFRVIEKDGKAYIDLSSDEVTKLLYPYVSSTLRDMI